MNGRKYRIVLETIIKLHDYSDSILNVLIDNNLKLPGMTFLNEVNIPQIVLNLSLIPENVNIIAHVVAHEAGHQILGHVKIPPYQQTALDKCEDEADTFAATFLKIHNYDIDPIKDYIKSIHDKSIADRRIQILEAA